LTETIHLFTKGEKSVPSFGLRSEIANPTEFCVGGED
jgi:hypothetical protein